MKPEARSYRQTVRSLPTWLRKEMPWGHKVLNPAFVKLLGAMYAGKGLVTVRSYNNVYPPGLFQTDDTFNALRAAAATGRPQSGLSAKSVEAAIRVRQARQAQLHKERTTGQVRTVFHARVTQDSLEAVPRGVRRRQLDWLSRANSQPNTDVELVRRPLDTIPKFLGFIIVERADGTKYVYTETSGNERESDGSVTALTSDRQEFFGPGSPEIEIYEGHWAALALGDVALSTAATTPELQRQAAQLPS